MPANAFTHVEEEVFPSQESDFDNDIDDDDSYDSKDDDDVIITDDGSKIGMVGNNDDYSDKVDVDRLNHIGYSMEIKSDHASLPLPEMNEVSSYDYESPYESLQKKVESLNEEMDDDLESVKHD